MIYAFHDSATGRFLNLPADDFGTPRFKAAVEEAMKAGFKMIAAIALMKRASPDGHALIEYEAMPGASEIDVEAARDIWRDSLIGEGILKPDLTVN
jgi:hypothetical protein